MQCCVKQRGLVARRKRGFRPFIASRGFQTGCHKKVIARIMECVFRIQPINKILCQSQGFVLKRTAIRIGVVAARWRKCGMTGKLSRVPHDVLHPEC